LNDRRLLPYEIGSGSCWAKALEALGIFTPAEVTATRLAAPRQDFRGAGRMPVAKKSGAGAEDGPHSSATKALGEELGRLAETATGRSRNELVAPIR